MRNYKVTASRHGQMDTRWFTSREEMKRYAKGIIRLGFAPYIEVCDHGDYANLRKAFVPSLTVFGFFKAVDI